MISYTPNAVDWLKYVTATVRRDVESALDAIHYATEEAPEALSERIEADVQPLLDDVRRQVAEAAAAFVRDDRDLNTYSDGRPVCSLIEIGDGDLFSYIWHPQAMHPDNRPRTLAWTGTRDGGARRIVIRAPGVLAATDL